MKKVLGYNVNLPVVIFKEDNAFIAYTPALDLSTAGETFEIAKKRFNEAVKIFFNEVIGKGTLDEVLADNGWTKINKNWQAPATVFHNNIPVSI